VKLVLYVVFGFLVMMAAILLLVRGAVPDTHPLAMLGLVILFGIPPFGAFWMMYVSIRYEKRPVPLLLLALLIPFSFLWYYFERVRPGKLARNRDFVRP
jgi:hypothetical protein